MREQSQTVDIKQSRTVIPERRGEESLTITIGLGWITHKLESRFQGEMSTASHMQVMPLMPHQ